jgi:uncharacterized membrane protein
MSSAAQRASSRDHIKWIFFAVAAIGAVLAVYADERFLFNSADPEWTHIAPARWLLLFHGLAGAVAFLIGPFQFSDTIRRTRIRLHRWMGRIYVGAVVIAAPMGLMVALRLEEPLTKMAIPAVAGGWLACTVMALVCVLRRNLDWHKRWMMKSYGFTLIFMVSRVPDFFGIHWTDALLSTYLWYCVAGALIGPDLILTARELWRKRAMKA